MKFAGMSPSGRIASRFAMCLAPPHKAGTILARINKKGFISPSATIYHTGLTLKDNVFIGDRVVIYQADDGGPVELHNGVSLLRDTIIETGFGGSLIIGNETWIHPRCQINAYMAPITIGRGAQIAPSCAIYSYDHCFASGEKIRKQGLQSKGPIVIGDDAWLAVGVTVLSGVTIGKGAVVGAGSVVTKDVPDEGIAVGNPARVVKMRDY